MTLNIAPALTVGISSQNKYLAILEDAWQQHLAPRQDNALTVISTFAGCGGSSLGYSIAGYRELLAVEWDDNAVETFKLNFPDVPVYHGDIAKLSVEQVLTMTGLKPGELDVFDGSPPCQGFSTAGKRVMDDPRNQLFREYVRLLQGLQPKVFVMENVSGMVKGKMKLVFVEILKELKACGYRVKACLLNAKFFNVPQSRERMIFIGVRNDLNIEPSHPKAISQPFTAGDAVYSVAVDELEREMLLEAGLKYAAYEDWREMPLGSSRDDLEGRNSGFNCVKVNPLKPSPTVAKNNGNISMHGLMHWGEQRRFSVNEFKRLGSFPDNFRFWGEWKDAVMRIGNSVPPLFMAVIAGHIRCEILAI